MTLRHYIRKVKAEWPPEDDVLYTHPSWDRYAQKESGYMEPKINLTVEQADKIFSKMRKIRMPMSDWFLILAALRYTLSKPPVDSGCVGDARVRTQELEKEIGGLF